MKIVFNLFLLCVCMSLLAGCLNLDKSSVEVKEEKAKIASTTRQLSPYETLPIGVVGAAEYVYVKPFAKPFKARIDTGAVLSSIGVSEIQRFERDGKRWVKFSITQRSSGEKHIFERRVVKRVAIKNRSSVNKKKFGNDDDSDDKKSFMRRYVVKMRIKLGGVELNKQFNLADREYFDYPILIGRNVLAGNAIVDVSKQNLQSK